MTKKLIRGRRSNAFSLLEILVSMAMLMMLMGAIFAILDSSGRVARNQVELAAMQQSSRVAQGELVRYLRMAGIGGLPLTWNRLPDPPATQIDYTTPGAFPNGFAIALRNNVAQGTMIPTATISGVESHWVVPGSDILIVRGVFTTPMIYLKPQMQIASWVDAANKIPARQIEIPNKLFLEYDQDLETFKTKIQSALDESPPRRLALIVRDLKNPDAYGVVQLNPGNTDLTEAQCTAYKPESGTIDPRIPDCIKLGVVFDPTNSSMLSEEYGNLSLGTNLTPDAGSLQVNLSSSAPPATLRCDGNSKHCVAFPTEIGSIGILEEFRFYVRADIDPVQSADGTPRMILSRAEYLPMTEELIERIDLSDNVLDLQIAVGIDADRRIAAVEKGQVIDNDSADDEILFNSPNDQLIISPPGLSGKFIDPVPSHIAWFNPKLDVHFIRLSTVTQANRRDPNYQAARLGVIEDSDRGATFYINGQPYNFNTDRRQRRRLITTVVEMRNLK